MATGREGIQQRVRLLAGGLVLAAVVVACSEDYEGGAACPALCPEQNVVVFDTVFDPVEFDTTITGFPTHGVGTELLLARRGDTVDTRPVVRFDSLPIYYNSGGVDTVIQVVDSPFVRLRLNRPRSFFTGPVTFEVFNVDTVVGDSATAAQDTSTAIEKQLFRPDRLIGSITLDSADITDSVRIPIDSLTLINTILEQRRLRLGFRATSDGPVQIRIIANEGGDPPTLRFLASETGTDFDTVFVLPESSVPRAQPTIRSDLTDYTLVINFPPVPDGSFLTVGGVPGRRPLIRFMIPAHILDSSNVLRATLELTQFPVPSVDDTVRMTIFPLVVTAGKLITDPARSAFLTNLPGAGFDSVQFAPGDSGVREIEIVNALRAWGVPIAVDAQRGIVLQAASESVDPRFVSFFSSRAADPSVRPRLRISYSPVRTFGIP
jgi:hypothetical protein